MISIKLIPVDKEKTKSENTGTRNTVTRNDNTEVYIPNDIELNTLKIGDAYLGYDKGANALKVYGANNGSMNLYALGGVAALGQSSIQGGGSGSGGSGGGGTSYNRLDSWEAYDANKAGWVLSAGLGNDLNSRVASLENGQIEGVATQEWVQNQGFATENWVTKKGYLTSLAHNHTITIGNASKSVGVGGTAAFTLADIGAQAAGNYATSGHTHSVKINGQVKTIAASGGTAVDLGTYLTKHQDISGKADKATTLEGYKITDAKIENGVITLGKNTITPLTSHQSLAAYATTEWVTNNFNKYVLPVAGTAIGGVKSGTDITVDANGNVSVNDNSHNHKWANISDKPASLPASDVYAWAKKSTKPSYTLDEVTDGSTRKWSNYVTDIGASGDKLTWSKNGVAQTAITVPFATNATNATNAATATKLGTDAGSNVKPVYFSDGKPAECNYQFGNKSGNAAVSNGTVCTNLNADKLDGHDGSYYATAADVKTLQGYFTNGVANKATKLATPRTIWGQSFDGTANVSGAMTGVTSMDGLIYFNTTNNYIGIGTTSPNYKLDVAGVIHSSTGIFSDGYVSALGQNTSSDERLKDIKGDINISIDVLANAPSKLFEWKDNKALGTQVGTIAQYWQKVLPQVVHDRGDGYLAMQYDVTALLAVISVAKMVQNHEARIKKLEQENEALREQLKELKG
jgi:hypothetical protein